MCSIDYAASCQQMPIKLLEFKLQMGKNQIAALSEETLEESRAEALI